MLCGWACFPVHAISKVYAEGVVSAASLRPTFYDTRGSIDVALFEREQLRGVKRGRGREHDHRTEARPELLGERANLRPGIERPLRRELGKAHLTRPAVAFPSSQRSFATVTSFRLQVLLDPLAERQIRRTAIGQDPAQLDLERPLRLSLAAEPAHLQPRRTAPATR